MSHICATNQPENMVIGLLLRLCADISKVTAHERIQHLYDSLHIVIYFSYNTGLPSLEKNIFLWLLHFSGNKTQTSRSNFHFYS
jgi:hypothetical protein